MQLIDQSLVKMLLLELPDNYHGETEDGALRQVMGMEGAVYQGITMKELIVSAKNKQIPVHGVDHPDLCKNQLGTDHLGMTKRNSKIAENYNKLIQGNGAGVVILFGSDHFGDSACGAAALEFYIRGLGYAKCDKPSYWV